MRYAKGSVSEFRADIFAKFALAVLLLASNLISAIAPSFAVMLIGRALLGASLGGFWTVALGASGQLIRDCRGDRRRHEEEAER